LLWGEPGRALVLGVLGWFLGIGWFSFLGERLECGGPCSVEDSDFGSSRTRKWILRFAQDDGLGSSNSAVLTGRKTVLFSKSCLNLSFSSYVAGRKRGTART
jgi:hypothetical protein